MSTYKIIAISGSLREKSVNTQLIHAAKELAPAGTEIEFVSVGHVPLYNQDDEASFPEAITTLKEQIRAADGIIISTPEYNRSIPGVLKNFIDWTSRPYGDSAWAGKPVLIMGASPAPTGTTLAQGHLRSIMLYLNAFVLGQPETYIGGAFQKFDESGALTDEDTRTHLATVLTAFTKFIDRVKE